VVTKRIEIAVPFHLQSLFEQPRRPVQIPLAVEVVRVRLISAAASNARFGQFRIGRDSRLARLAIDGKSRTMGLIQGNRP
jgi:hypothetical protein